MPNLKPASRRTATKGKHRRRRGRRGHSGWWHPVKVAFLLERPRRRPSSPSHRQIALVVVSAGLAIVVIRTLSRRKGGSAAAEPQTAQPQTAQPQTAQPQTAPPAQPETAQPDTAQSETVQPETQDEARETPSSDTAPGNDNGLADESSLTDRVQSEISRRDDAPAPATEAD
jgi:hypothetical protein